MSWFCEMQFGPCILDDWENKIDKNFLCVCGCIHYCSYVICCCTCYLLLLLLFTAAVINEDGWRRMYVRGAEAGHLGQAFGCRCLRASALRASVWVLLRLGAEKFGCQTKFKKKISILFFWSWLFSRAKNYENY